MLSWDLRMSHNSNSGDEQTADDISSEGCHYHAPGDMRGLVKLVSWHARGSNTLISTLSKCCFTVTHANRRCWFFFYQSVIVDGERHFYVVSLETFCVRLKALGTIEGLRLTNCLWQHEPDVTVAISIV